jgi:hypothetical protein
LNGVNLYNTVVAWNPNIPEVPAGRRGVAVLLPWPESRVAASAFVFCDGAVSAAGQDPRREVRAGLLEQIALTMVERDVLAARVVHRVLLGLDEWKYLMGTHLGLHSSDAATAPGSNADADARAHGPRRYAPISMRLAVPRVVR